MPALLSITAAAAVNGAYLISAAAGQVEVCLPYVQGCCSVSAAARQTPAIHLFRATMIPMGALLAAIWWVAGHWLAEAGDRSRSPRRWMMAAGLAGALSLVLYATFLGTQGAAYPLLRRYGATTFFGFTALAQLMLTARLGRLVRRPGSDASQRGMTALAAAMVILGLGHVALSALYDQRNAENAIEWTLVLLMMAWFALLAVRWKRDALSVVAHMRGP